MPPALSDDESAMLSTPLLGQVCVLQASRAARFLVDRSSVLTGGFPSVPILDVTLSLEPPDAVARLVSLFISPRNDFTIHIPTGQVLASSLNASMHWCDLFSANRCWTGLPRYMDIVWTERAPNSDTILYYISECLLASEINMIIYSCICACFRVSEASRSSAERVTASAAIRARVSLPTSVDGGLSVDLGRDSRIQQYLSFISAN